MGGRNAPEAIPVIRAKSDLQELSLRHLAPSPPVAVSEPRGSYGRSILRAVSHCNTIRPVLLSAKRHSMATRADFGLETRAAVRRREAEQIIRGVDHARLQHGLRNTRAHVRLGAILGARLANLLTGLEDYSADVVTDAPPDDAWAVTLASLNAMGEVLSSRHETDALTLLGIVRHVKGGPAVVYADVLTADRSGAVISLSGFAQSYLTNRGVSQMAVDSVATAIRRTLAQINSVGFQELA